MGGGSKLRVFEQASAVSALLAGSVYGEVKIAKEAVARIKFNLRKHTSFSCTKSTYNWRKNHLNFQRGYC